MKKNLEDIVLNALEKIKLARQDDFILYGVVLQSLGVNLNRPLKDLFIYHKEMGCPSFESVTRCRRKIQETRRDLIDCSTAKIRKDKEEEFRAWSRKR